MRASSDDKLTAIDHRILTYVAALDGRSLSNGKGPGCTVSRQKIAEAVRCSKVSAVASIRKLVERGYFVKEPSADHRQMHTLRVIYDGEDITGTGKGLLSGLLLATGKADLTGLLVGTGKVGRQNRLSPAAKPVKSRNFKPRKNNGNSDNTTYTKRTRKYFAPRSGFLNGPRDAATRPGNDEACISAEQMAELRKDPAGFWAKQENGT
jgi:hypothetical protein